MSDQDGTFKTHKPVMISHYRPFILRKSLALEGVLHRLRPNKNTPHTPLLLLIAKKESLSMRQWYLIRMKTPRQARWPWNHIHCRNSSWQPYSYPVHAIEKKDSTPQDQNWTSQAKDQTNHVGAGSLPISPDNEAPSQWLTCCNMLITTTDILHQSDFCMVRARPPFPPSLFSHFPSSI